MTVRPQYDDSFIEYLRLKMILEGMDETQQGLAAANAASAAGADDPFGCAPAHLRRVQQLCVNAEPNYGSAWFSCKREAHWAPVEVLQVAGEMIQRHLVANQRQYARAILAGWYRKESESMAVANAAAAKTNTGTGRGNAGIDGAATTGGHTRARSSVQQLLALLLVSAAGASASSSADRPSSVHSTLSLSRIHPLLSYELSLPDGTPLAGFHPDAPPSAAAADHRRRRVEALAKQRLRQTMAADDARSQRPFESMDATARHEAHSSPPPSVFPARPHRSSSRSGRAVTLQPYPSDLSCASRLPAEGERESTFPLGETVPFGASFEENIGAIHRRALVQVPLRLVDHSAPSSSSSSSSDGEEFVEARDASGRVSAGGRDTAGRTMVGLPAATSSSANPFSLFFGIIRFALFICLFVCLLFVWLVVCSCLLAGYELCAAHPEHLSRRHSCRVHPPCPSRWLLRAWLARADPARRRALRNERALQRPLRRCRRL